MTTTRGTRPADVSHYAGQGLMTHDSGSEG
jgi:hypothetical protein